MKTLVLGAAIVDIIMKIPKLPKSGEDVLCTERKVTVGGCAYNVANILRGFNVEHDLFVPIGSGMYADIIRKTLNEDGYDVLISDSEMDNGYCLCLVEDDGERTFITVKGIEGLHKKEWFNSLNMSKYENIYVAGYQLCEDKDDIIANWLIEQKGKNIFFAPGPVINDIDKNTMRKIFSTNPILHLNEKEALDFTKKDNVEESILSLYELTKNIVFVTVGKRGTVFYDGKEIVYIKGETVNVVDTIGAGDSHIGAIISAYSLGATNGFSLVDSSKLYSKDSRNISLDNSQAECLENNVGYNFVSVCKLANKIAAEVVQIQGAKLSKECFDKFKV